MEAEALPDITVKYDVLAVPAFLLFKVSVCDLTVKYEVVAVRTARNYEGIGDADVVDGQLGQEQCTSQISELLLNNVLFILIEHYNLF